MYIILYIYEDLMKLSHILINIEIFTKMLHVPYIYITYYIMKQYINPRNAHSMLPPLFE